MSRKAEIKAWTDEIKTCRQCGKTFTVLEPASWAYKRMIAGRYQYFCTWKCLRANERGEERKEPETMKTENERPKRGRPPRDAEKPKVVLVQDPAIAEEYRREQEAKTAEERGRQIAEKLDKADKARREMIDGIAPLEPAALKSRTIQGGIFEIDEDGLMVLRNNNASIKLTAYEWFKLTEEILVAIRQLDATRPAEE